MVVEVNRSMLAVALVLGACQGARAEVRIEQHVEPGKPFLLSDGTTYEPGERFRVNDEHRIPEAMVVQGDTVVLRAVGDRLDRATPPRWQIVRGWANPKLAVDAADPRVARFTADGYGINRIAFEATVDGRRVTVQAEVSVEFSTGNMLVSKEAIPLPPDAETNPLVNPVDHRPKPENRPADHALAGQVRRGRRLSDGRGGDGQRRPRHHLEGETLPLPPGGRQQRVG